VSAASATAVPRASLAHAVVATAIMLGSLLASWWLTPTRYWFDELGRPDLQQMVPRQFGDWVMSDKAAVMLVNPEQVETLHVIYSQTLSRLYLNRNSGRIIMLSIALGVDQSHATQLHHPEACYRTQGFVIDDARYDILNSPAGPIKLTRFNSHTHSRAEPVSYWIRVGKWNARSWSEVNSSRLALAASGYVADGLLFRVSEISGDPVSSFPLQDQFINDLINAVPPSQWPALIGLTSS
jgi:EpsI family protein